jgi:hypothetical protein
MFFTEQKSVISEGVLQRPEVIYRDVFTDLPGPAYYTYIQWVRDREKPHLDGCTDKKEKKIFLIYKEIQSGAVAKSFMKKGFLIYEERRTYFPIYEEAVSHI